MDHSDPRTARYARSETVRTPRLQKCNGKVDRPRPFPKPACRESDSELRVLRGAQNSCWARVEDSITRQPPHRFRVAQESTPTMRGRTFPQTPGARH